MKRLRFLFVTVLAIAALSVHALALDAFEIASYDVRMEVRSDNSYRITETIDVEYSARRHGIIRNLPRRTYRGARAAISEVDVADYQFKTARRGGDLEITIGDPGEYAAEREKYVISYVYAIGEDGLGAMDEIYWNLIGTEWDCYINNVSFTIEMPFDFKDDELNFTYGRYGSRQSDGVSWRVNGRTVTGTLDGRLDPREALTVALPLPQGYFADAKPLPLDPLDLLPLLIPIAAVGAGFALWSVMGRKRQAFPTVEFYPPQGTTSADAGYLIDGRVDPFDITSLIIFWADRGYLSITEQTTKKLIGRHKSFLLTRLAEPGADSRDYEREMFEELFDLGDGYNVSTDELKNRFYSTVEQAKAEVKHSFEGNPDTRIFAKSNGLCRWLLRGIAFLTAFHVAYTVTGELTGSYGAQQWLYGGLLSAMLMTCLFAAAAVISGWKGLDKRVAKLFFSLFFGGILSAVLCHTAYGSGELLYAAATIIGVLALGCFTAKCSRRTKLGLWYEEKLTGFREFIKATELDRIKLLVQENPHYFYHVLPYAMVLGVTDKWAKNFDSIAVQPPDWYRSEKHGGFNAAGFARDLESGMRVVSAAMTSRPSSGGSGGSSDGGSAGGGSGGGGGRSW